MSRVRADKRAAKHSQPSIQEPPERSTVPVAETRTDPNTEARSDLSHDEIAQRAYQCWHERGCPHGSPEIDWTRAEEELHNQQRRAADELNGNRRAQAVFPSI